MLTVKGLNIDHLDFAITKKGDFLSFEGPFLSHFYDTEGNDYLMIWIDNNSKHNRWLLFKTEKVKLFKYLTREYSLKKLFEISNYEIIYIIDINNDCDYKKILLTIKDNIPSDYLPKSNSYFEEDFADKYAILLKEELALAINDNENKNDKIVTSKIVTVRKKSTKHQIIPHFYGGSSVFEILALKSSFRGVWMHCDNFKSNEFKYLISIHSSAYTNPLNLDLYFTELNRLLDNRINSSINAINITLILEKLIISTIEIVKNNPEKYKAEFINWRQELLTYPSVNDNISQRLNDLEL